LRKRKKIHKLLYFECSPPWHIVMTFYHPFWQSFGHPIWQVFGSSPLRSGDQVGN
jgi:hypothetical protein